MLKEKLTMLINTCDKFSDLWDTHIELLEKNWKERNIKTILVTDKETNKKYENVDIYSAGEKKELSERIESVLLNVKTEYILITLDDYFPIYKINSEAIENIISEMEENKLDYVRLFKRPNSNVKLSEKSSLYKIDLYDKRDSNYQVNLYVGIWRKEFLKKTVKEPLNAWDYELSLTKIARKENARCAMSKGKEFETLDVVRKGKLLHKAYRYLKKNNLYNGPREVISWKIEWKINILTFIKDHTNQKIVDLGKSVLRKFGFKFYSDR